MKVLFTTALLLAFGAVSAQQKKTVKDTVVYKYEPRYYNVAPCGCPPPKKDIITVKKDSLKPLDITFVRRKEKRRF